jgi:hypothetical protein
LAACKCVRAVVCAGRNDVLVNLAVFELSLLKCALES